MANRYWAGGSGTWNTSSTTNWSAASPILFTASRSGSTLTTTGSPALVVGMTVWYNTDQFTGTFTSAGTITGGSGNTWTTSGSGTISSQSMTAATVGASAPTSADNIFISGNGTSNASTITVSGSAACNNFTNSGNANFATSSGMLYVYGNFSMNVAPPSAFPVSITFRATTTGKSFFPNNATYSSSEIIFDGVGGGWTLSDNLISTSTLSLVNGTFNTGNYNIDASKFTSNTNSGFTNIRAIDMGSSTITLSGSGYVWTVDDSFGSYTQTRGTSTLSLTSASAKQIYCAGYNFYNVVQAGTGTLTYTGGFTINNMTATALPTTIKLNSGGPYTFTTFGLTGVSSGSSLTLTSTSYGSPAYLSLASGSGTVSVSYCTLEDINVASYGSGTTWLAYVANGNVDNGGNTGWVFAPASTGNFMAFF